jgi:uncharacterized LabA/DUF88 family protein
MKHNEQRVLVLFDVQNMYYSAKHLYNTKVNFKEILKTAVAGRKLIRAIAYAIKTEIKEESVFHDALEKIGIEVKTKDLQIFYGGAKKGDWDIGIAMDAVRLSPKVDAVVIVSGDGDFKDLANYLKSHGCRAEAIAFGETTSKHLKESVDDFVDLSRDKRRYLIRGNACRQGSRPPMGNRPPMGSRPPMGNRPMSSQPPKGASIRQQPPRMGKPVHKPIINKGARPAAVIVKKAVATAKPSPKSPAQEDTVVNNTHLDDIAKPTPKKVVKKLPVKKVKSGAPAKATKPAVKKKVVKKK